MQDVIRQVLHYKKPTLWIIIAMAAVLVILAVCFLASSTKKYQIRVTIPAGSTEPVCCSDEEISPKGNTLTFYAGEGLEDTEITLLPTEVREENVLKKIVITFIECICFFLGWAILSAVLPLSNSDNPAVWRLWAEITPLLSIIAFTFLFWIIEKKTIKLHLFNNPIKGVLTGMITGILWLGFPVVIMKLMKAIGFSGKNDIPLFFVWILAAFLNVIMQELLVRGWLYQALKQKYNIAISTIVTTALFTLLHGGAFEAGVVPVVNVLTMSLLMTVILEYSGSLIAPTIMHFIWNGIGALVLGGVSLADDYPHLLNMTFSGSNLLSGGECKIEGSIVVLAVNVILLAVFIGLQRKNRNDIADHA